MATKNIEININTGSSYDILYPKTSWDNIESKPTIPSVPSLPLSIANGGTGSSNASSGVYNLISPLSTRTASNLNSYASSTYIPCYYGTSGYRFALSNIMTYVNNNVTSSSKACVSVTAYTGTGVRRPNMSIPSISGFSPRAITFNDNKGTDDSFDGTGLFSAMWGMLEPNVEHALMISFGDASITTIGYTLNSSGTSIACDFSTRYYFNVSGHSYFMIVLYV